MEKFFNFPRFVNEIFHLKLLIGGGTNRSRQIRFSILFLQILSTTGLCLIEALFYHLGKSHDSLKLFIHVALLVNILVTYVVIFTHRQEIQKVLQVLNPTRKFKAFERFQHGSLVLVCVALSLLLALNVVGVVSENQKIIILKSIPIDNLNIGVLLIILVIFYAILICTHLMKYALDMVQFKLIYAMAVEFEALEREFVKLSKERKCVRKKGNKTLTTVVSLTGPIPSTSGGYYGNLLSKFPPRVRKINFKTVEVK
jgi:hypothetical protein